MRLPLIDIVTQATSLDKISVTSNTKRVVLQSQLGAPTQDTNVLTLHRTETGLELHALLDTEDAIEAKLADNDSGYEQARNIIAWWAGYIRHYAKAHEILHKLGEAISAATHNDDEAHEGTATVTAIDTKQHGLDAVWNELPEYTCYNDQHATKMYGIVQPSEPMLRWIIMYDATSLYIPCVIQSMHGEKTYANVYHVSDIINAFDRTFTQLLSTRSIEEKMPTTAQATTQAPATPYSEQREAILAERNAEFQQRLDEAMKKHDPRTQSQNDAPQAQNDDRDPNIDYVSDNRGTHKVKVRFKPIQAGENGSETKRVFDTMLQYT